MLFDIISNDKRELSIGLIHHIAGWYVKCALPFTIDYYWTDDAVGNRHKQLTIDFLCFSVYVEYWRWHVKEK
jgi:hypothetical protein